MSGDDAAALSFVLGAALDSSTRLYRLDAVGELTGLQVEAFVLEEALSQPWRLELSLLHERVDIDIDAMLARQVTLVTRLADGSEHRRTGMVAQAAAEDSDGGLARYRLVVQPWLGFLAQSIRSIAWQEKSVNAIVDSVLDHFASYGRWRWSGCALQLLAESSQGGNRSYCVQYRESDLAFIDRLLAEEGIGYRFEESPAGAPGPTVVFFADSTSTESMPEDASCAGVAGGAGIRFHADGVQEEQDTVQAFGSVRSQPVAVVSAVSYDYKTGRVVAAEVPTAGSVGGGHAPRLEAYDSTQGYAYADARQAERAMVLRQQALEARHERWIGRGVVRSFAAGNRFTLTESMLDAFGTTAEGKRFLLTRVTHVGINNLPKETNDRLRVGALYDVGSFGGIDVLPRWIDPALRARAAARGYANHFEAIRQAVPWRPLRTDESGGRFNPKPVVPGPLQATVVGPDGSTRPQGSQEVHTDRMGRVRIRYEFQDDTPEGAQASTWVRVLQPLAGDGVGAHWTPRIGHEVLVGFFDDDIDRPYVICSLYGGRGEGGEAATPGGREASAEDQAVFSQSSDARPAGQGNLTGGLSPAWHGASPAELEQGGQRNAGALSGYKTREFGGDGYNQLVFDDSAAQLRVQLATTQHASQLNLGHLIHQADNHRGSFRGLGFELRTDAYGAVRGGQGVLLSTYATNSSEPAGDNAAGIALARQWNNLAGIFDRAATTHQTVRLSGVIGTAGAGKSATDDKAAPIAAWLKQTSGMVAAEGLEAAKTDAAVKSTSTEDGKLPHGSDAVISVSARGGLGMAAGQDVVLAAEENAQLGSGGGIDIAAGGALRVHTGQAIGILGGAIEPGKADGASAAGTGITLVTGSGDIDIQAQAATLQVAALGDVKIQSQSAGVDWAAARKITMTVAGGASLTIEGGNVTVECPGTMTVRAGRKSFVGQERFSYPMPQLPHKAIEDIPVKFNMVLTDIPGPNGVALPFTEWRIVHASDQGAALHSDKRVLSGKSDKQGRLAPSSSDEQALHQAWNASPGRLWLVSEGHVHQIVLSREHDGWTDDQKRMEALDAMGYSDDYGSTGDRPVDDFHTRLAMDETNARSGETLLNKTKGPAR